ncbi:MAG: ribonuclease HI family protein [bacterium]
METGRGKNTPSSAAPGAKEVLEFLAENQSFRALYKKFPNLKKAGVRKVLIGAGSCFKSKIKERRNKHRTRFTCYVDGAAQPNPGPAGAGAVIYRNAVKVKEISKFLGRRTNNQAEYEALDIALGEVLKILEENSAVSFFSDSLLLVNQVTGRWRVNDGNIIVLLGKARRKIKRISSKKSVKFSIEHIDRRKNKEADSLSVLAIRRENLVE